MSLLLIGALALAPAAAASATLPAAASATPATATPAASVAAALVPGVCAPGAVAATNPPAYYAIDLISTKRLPGTRDATGAAHVRFARSPFGIAVSPRGEYDYDLEIDIDGLRAARSGVHVVWIAKPDLSEITRLGVLPEDGRLVGRTTWNKFLVVITRESDDDPAALRWNGTIVLRGMSRSGRMHTMAGHGPYQAEPCARYGY